MTPVFCKCFKVVYEKTRIREDRAEFTDEQRHHMNYGDLYTKQRYIDEYRCCFRFVTKDGQPEIVMELDDEQLLESVGETTSLMETMVTSHGNDVEVSGLIMGFVDSGSPVSQQMI